jgi:hypothetical protein
MGARWAAAQYLTRNGNYPFPLLQTQLFLLFRLGIKRRSNLHQPANSGKVVFAQARCGGSRN